MQFIANGPDIPDSLLQAHAEGRVVFFCGAGISYPAGLPGFKGLVDQIYERVGTRRSPIEQEAYSRNQFDATLDLLERRLPGQREAVRRALADALKPKWRKKGATETHAALLALGKSPEGPLRLVTTNFDRIFERIGKRRFVEFRSHSAPMLPIPKNSRWDGLVYLHGLLPQNPDGSALNHLVLTSGDFGLAYLTERWAARFVSELFRHYVVCFVGYSIDDPVLRYMMDALAADRMLGEVTPQAYAFGECAPGDETSKTTEWEAKGVSPILYYLSAGTQDHSALHRTLQAWAKTYSDGVLGIERLIVDHALARPSASTRQDDYVGRVLWALSHQSGLPAKRFAEFNPVPSLDWLEAFANERYLHADLARFGVSPAKEVDEKLKFSLIQRPAPYQNAPWMKLTSGGAETQWDDVLYQIARWLVRYLNNPALVIWLAQRGGSLRERWKWLIDRELDRFAKLEAEGRTAELDEIRANAPDAIPNSLMRTLWRLLLGGRVKASWHEFSFFDWLSRLKRDGLSVSLRLELRDLLAPKVQLREPIHWPRGEAQTGEPTRIRHLVDWELELAASHVRSALRDASGDRWGSALPQLLDDFQQLLRDALDLLRELGEADDQSDRSHWDLPSVSPHRQNRGFRNWVTLIELVRDAWQALRETEPARARCIAVSWFGVPYPTFKRLAFYAAAHDEGIESSVWVDWLVHANGWWLWSIDTRREVMRLLVLKGVTLSTPAREKLEGSILVGPPRDMYRDGIESDEWQSLVDHSIWLRLAKLHENGAQLGDRAVMRLNELRAANPHWRLAENEQDEFSHWMSGTGDPDFNQHREQDVAPRTRAELTSWLRKPVPEHRPFYEDTWRDTLRTRFFHSLLALRDLSNDNVWPVERWREAFQVWSEDGFALRSWRFVPSLVRDMPEVVMANVAHAFTRWLQSVSKEVYRRPEEFIGLCRQALALPIEEDSGIRRNDEPIDQPVTEAINHPVGQTVEALLNFWFKTEPNDNDFLPADLKPLFTMICDVEVAKFRHGRVLLASRLIAIFRVDRAWTEANLLPLFDWSRDPIEARAAWEGFLWSPRLYGPLLIAFKTCFLDTANHYSELGEHSRQYAAFLTFAALDPVAGFSPEDFEAAVGSLPQEGLQEVSQALSQALEGAGDQREEYWTNRVQPFWQTIWPKSRDLASVAIAEDLARLAIAAGRKFPVALTVIGDWLRPIEHVDYLIHLLLKSGLIGLHAEASLRFLDAVIGDRVWAPQELAQALSEIAQAAPGLTQDRRYQRLNDFVRRQGM